MVRSQEVNWEEYFQHIKPVCPWSGAALKKGELKIIQWSGEIEPLGNNQAIVYICPNYNRRRPSNMFGVPRVNVYNYRPTYYTFNRNTL